jgi:hypothetical protein
MTCENPIFPLIIAHRRIASYLVAAGYTDFRDVAGKRLDPALLSRVLPGATASL